MYLGKRRGGGGVFPELLPALTLSLQFREFCQLGRQFTTCAPGFWGQRVFTSEEGSLVVGEEVSPTPR